jgi:glycosyltransferase involved in cell wall biosynthesis
MTLEFKKQPITTQPNSPTINFDETKYNTTEIGIPLAPVGMPLGIPPVFRTSIIRKQMAPPPLALPGSDLPRAINYLADYSGCGWWRIGSPEVLLNYSNKMIISSLTTMSIDPKFYLSGFCAIKLQRQATPVQKEFVRFLKQMGKQLNSKIIYEVDDIVLHEDIPLFNRCRTAFTDPEIRKSIEEIMDMCDEFMVVSEYMRDYYASKISNKKITCVPNYAPRFWFDRYYDEDRTHREYNKNKKRPKILVTASGTHFDVINATNQQDDYSHVIQNIISTRKDFQWIFMGGYPLLLKPFIDNGDIQFKDWSPLLQFPQTIYDLAPQVTIAALATNNFNRAKSFIKLTESSHLGIPFVGQNLEPYKEAFHKFVTGDEMVDHIKEIVKSSDNYMKESRKARKYGDAFWLDDHLNEHIAIYTTKYGDIKRKELAPAIIKYNPEQFKT